MSDPRALRPGSPEGREPVRPADRLAPGRQVDPDDLLSLGGPDEERERPARSAGRRSARDGQARSRARAAALVDEREDDPYEDFLGPDEPDRRDYVRLPRRGGLLRRMVLSFGALVVVALVAAALGAFWLFRQVDPPGASGPEVELVVPEGVTGNEIASLLEDEGVVANGSLFSQYVKLRGKDSAGRFLSGRYRFALNSSMGEALAALEEGPIPVEVVTITLTEGLRLPELLDSVAEQAPWLDRSRLEQVVAEGRINSPYLPANAMTYEGLFFPDTYEVARTSDEADFLQRLADQMVHVGDQEGLIDKAAALGYTPYQVLTIASMIEREARVDGDRPKIARVIYNRLVDGTRLDIDATVLYALGRTSGGLSESDLAVDSPYNTRLYPGIPPSPIAAPGRAAIQAALEPANGPWLYYVLADADGTHYFTDSYSDFLAAVAEAEAKGLI